MSVRKINYFKCAIYMCGLLQFCVANVSSASSMSSYHVGNSLTWDARVGSFSEMSSSVGINHDVGHQIKCSKSLPFIVDNPDGACVALTTFGNWSDALPGYAWDVVTLQLHPSDGSNLQSDVSAALTLIDAAQTNASNNDTRFIIYGAWPGNDGDYTTKWQASIDPSDPTTPTSHSDAYQSAVFDQVSTARPDASVELLQTGKLLYLADQAIKGEVNGGGDWFGMTDVDDLYRDSIHLEYGAGRWLAALTMWSAVTGEDPSGMLVPDSGWGSDVDIRTDPILRDGLSQFVSDSIGEIHTLPESFSIGDMDGSGELNNADIAPFVLSLTDPSGYASTYPTLDPDIIGDFSGNGILDNADIAGFVDALTGGSSGSFTEEDLQQLSALVSVPEPSSLALLGLGGLLIARRRR